MTSHERPRNIPNLNNVAHKQSGTVHIQKQLRQAQQVHKPAPAGTVQIDKQLREAQQQMKPSAKRRIHLSTLDSDRAFIKSFKSNRKTVEPQELIVRHQRNKVYFLTFELEKNN